ncbi:hypothetical protein [Sphingomicrobium sediminis]|uniref:Sugar transporter n=1 Tax=Sphingomicrobium sediminis TaxID=2950949 RepID=A0A9X2EJ54_9SPHN|nr:hypothetical protein [Sphingomicrobium sediminis]MCM8557746.1 hypothetical protein [Sphingomicrobium sediminis]
MTDHIVTSNETAAAPKAPWHLWAVGIVSLLWNLIGANDYVQSQLRNEEYLAMGESMGVTMEEMIAYLDAMPMSQEAAWAFGVWGSVVGSILLLLRSRHAFTAFLVSFLGMMASLVVEMAGLTDRPLAMEGAVATIMPWLIVIIAVFLLWYSRSMATKGVLK